MTQCIPAIRLQQVFLLVCLLARVPEAVGIEKAHDKLTAGHRMASTLHTDGGAKALGIDTRGRVSWAAERADDKKSHEELDQSSAVVVRREAAPSVLIDGAGVVGADGQADKVLPELKDTPSSLKVILACLLAIFVLMFFCAGTAWVVWQPFSAILEERAFDQAAATALLDAVPKSVPEGADDRTLMASQEQRVVTREAQLNLAWEKFLDSPLLAIDSTNLLARVLRHLIGSPDFGVQLKDLFGSLTDDGTKAIKKNDLERVCKAISGTLFNMDLQESISKVEHKKDYVCSIVMSDIEDFHWLFDRYEALFPADLPMDIQCFSGLVSLAVVWNCVRTLRTGSRTHMRAGQGKPPGAKQFPQQSQVAVSMTIKLGSRCSLEACAEIGVEGTDIFEPAAPVVVSDK